MHNPLLKQENSEGRKSYGLAGFIIVLLFLLLVFIAEGWQRNSPRISIADFSAKEIEELVGISNEMDNLLSSSREIPVAVKRNDQETPVRLKDLGSVEPDTCDYAGKNGGLTSQEIKVKKDYTPGEIKLESIDDFPSDFEEKQKLGDEWLKNFLDDVIFQALEQNGDHAGCIISMGPMKKKDRVFEKAKNDYEGNIMKVMDLSRATIVCQDLVYMKTALQVMYDNLCNDGCTDDDPNAKSYLIRIKNKGFDLDKFPDGFTMTKMADITCNIKPPGTPYAVEVQFAILPILLKKGELHGIYDIFRALKEPTPAQCYEFMKDSQDVMGSTWKNAIVDQEEDMKKLTKYLARLGTENDHDKTIQNLQRRFPNIAKNLIISLLSENENHGGKVAAILQDLQAHPEERKIQNLMSRFPSATREEIKTLLDENDGEVPPVARKLRADENH